MATYLLAALRKAPEPPRTRRGLRQITCHLFDEQPHGSHHYHRGDERVVCPGRPRKG